MKAEAVTDRFWKETGVKVAVGQFYFNLIYMYYSVVCFLLVYNIL